MGIYIVTQVYSFYKAVIVGISLSIFYDVFRIRRKILIMPNFITTIEDILFAFISSFVCFGCILTDFPSIMRGFTFIGITIGSIIYFLTISKYFVSFSVALINIICAILKKVFYIIIKPFSFIYCKICNMIKNNS